MNLRPSLKWGALWRSLCTQNLAIRPLQIQIIAHLPDPIDPATELLQKAKVLGHFSPTSLFVQVCANTLSGDFPATLSLLCPLSVGTTGSC